MVRLACAILLCASAGAIAQTIAPHWPRCLTKVVMPAYPSAARQGRVQGNVAVVYSFDQSGTAKYKTSGAQKSLVTALDKVLPVWTTSPGCRNVTIELVFQFQIKQGSAPEVAFVFPNVFSLSYPPRIPE